MSKEKRMTINIHKHLRYALGAFALLPLFVACSSPSDPNTDDNTGEGSGGSTLGSSGGASSGGAAASSGGSSTSTGGSSTNGSGGASDGSGGMTLGSGGESSASGGMTSTGGGPGDEMSRSMGCGKPLETLKNGVHKITSSGKEREFTIDIPADYDPEEAYRLIFTWHWINASDEAVVTGQVNPGGGATWAYYGLKMKSQTDGIPVIFIAPQSRNGTWDQEDHVLFDDMLAKAESELCIDTSRVFSTGFSFGGMQTYSLSIGKQDKLRAVAALSPANFNIYIPTNPHGKIAYMSATGMSDTLTPWDGGNNRGAKYAAIGHAEDNGCDIPATIPTTTVGSKSHVCYDFEGCDEGFPVKACTFDGGHIAAHADGGTGDNGATTWEATVSWEFFKQF